MGKENTLIITDLDGTFVHDSHSVKLEDQKAFRFFQDKAYLGIATGRSFKEISYIEHNFNVKVDFKIAFNGVIIEDEKRNILNNKPIGKKDLQDLLGLLKTNKLVFDALNGKERIGNYYSEDKGRLWGMNLICMEDPFDRVRKEKIYKVNIRPNHDDFGKYLADCKI